MDQKTKILVGILVAGIVLIGGWWIWSEQKEVRPTENITQPSNTELISCDEDDDCILVLHHICMCHCDMCAKAMAINKKYLDYWNAHNLSKVKPDCREMVCPMWMPPPGYCTEHCDDNIYRYNAKCKNNKCIAKPANGTLIVSTPPKTEYEKGETINIRVENQVGNPVNMGVENGCEGSVYVISKYTEGEWIDFPETCGGCDVDISTSIGANQVKIFFWNQSVYNNHEDCVLRSVSSGVYRVKVKYWNDNDFKIAYSNEFTIKEKHFDRIPPQPTIPCNNKTAEEYFMHGDYEKALECVERARERYLEINDPLGISKCDILISEINERIKEK